MPRSGHSGTSSSAVPRQSQPVTTKDRRPMMCAAILFALILAVYGTTLAHFFPAMPVIHRAADTLPNYADHYPPFRFDEYNYNTIARSVLAGNLYEPGSREYDYPAGFPIVAAPFVALFGDLGGYLANLFILWFSAMLFYRLARRHLPYTGALALTAVLAFATLNWFYATSCYTEPLSQLLVLGSFMLLTGGKAKDRSVMVRYAASGVLLGLNLFVRPHYILLGVPFAAYLAFPAGRRPEFTRFLGIFCGGTGAVVAFWMLRNGLIFGSPFSFEYSKLAGAFTHGSETAYMEGNIFLGTHRLLFDIYHGLFTITPIFLLFPVGLRSMWLRGCRRESLLLLSSVVIMALFVASGPYPFTEFGLGSRHLVPLMPLLLAPVACFLDRTLFTRSVVTVLAAYSFYHAGIGWFTGGEPGMGFYLGILNDNQARAAILSRKGLLQTRTFPSREALIAAYREALIDANLYRFLETLAPASREMISGNERTVMVELRRQTNPETYIESADPDSGITLGGIVFR